MAGTDTKACSRCGETKPLAEFGSRQGKCRPCQTEYDREYRKANAERLAAKRRDWYTKNRETNLAYQAEWRKANGDIKAASDARWREKNRERWIEQQRQYRKANREQIDATINAWREANPDKARDYRALKRARRRGAKGVVVRFDEILQRDLGICGICKKPIMEDTIHLDHIIPVAKGGAHDPSNIQIAHAPCNQRKSDRENYSPPDFP